MRGAKAETDVKASTTNNKLARNFIVLVFLSIYEVGQREL
jgi:hypothetical protein